MSYPDDDELPEEWPIYLVDCTCDHTDDSPKATHGIATNGPDEGCLTPECPCKGGWIDDA